MTAIAWGSELSPYSLKLEALCIHAGLPYARRPDGGGTLDNLRLLARIKSAQWRRKVRRWPANDALDEYPLVPYLLTDDGAVHMDSSAIAGWFDAQPPAQAAPLIPDDPLLGFVCRLLDEAVDEIGLYCVHHHRWVVSHDDNDAGARLAREFRTLVPAPLRPLMAERFSRRQIRRLPYLFSVAAPDKPVGRGARPPPPARAGFPETHRRLEAAWDELVDAATQALSSQPWLLGGHFTLADAALYGQLGMNLADPSSERRLSKRAPKLRTWLAQIAEGRHVGTTGPLRVHPDLEALLTWVERHFVPLMRANADAYARYRAQGQARWNEAAFDRNEALFDYEWCGAPARTVVKTFQLRVWRDLCVLARALPQDALRAAPTLERIVAAF
jgi:glutathione S-transferase